MKKFLVIALFCAPFASIGCQPPNVFDMSEAREPGTAKIMITLPGNNIVRFVAPCKPGDVISYGSKSGSMPPQTMNMTCVAEGTIGSISLS